MTAAAPELHPPALPEPPPRSAYPFFLTALGSWFGAWGMQTVIFQWLVVEALRESPERVGTAQMATMIPSLLFLLVGGALADRVDRRRALGTLHVLAALGYGSLGVVVVSGQLTYTVVIAYALLLGTLQAFVVPVRDAQLSDVARGTMSRAVAGLTMVQHGGQSLGALAAGLAGLFGAPPVLGLQAVIVLTGSLATWRLPPPQPRMFPLEPIHVRELRSGLVEVLRSPVLRSVMVLNISVGLTFLGAFLVLLPLLVRDLYGGGVEKMGILASGLPVGSMLVNSIIMARGGIDRPGRALLLGQGFSGLCLGAFSLGLPFWGAVAAAFGWGLGAAFAINTSRTLFQEHASEANRGRVLSVYSLGIMGTGPIGALLAGLMAGQWGVLTAFAVLSTAMTLLIGYTLLFTRMRHMR